MGSSEIFIQGVLVVIALISIVFLQTLPKRILTHYQSRRRRRQSTSPSSQARRHFISGAQTLTQARRHSPPSPSLLNSALSSANLAISLDPHGDAAPYLLKALALHLLGRTLPAIRSIDVALSPPLVGTLGKAEKADALVRRAEMQLGVNRRKRVDLAIRDLEEAIGLKKSGKGLVMLGECYEMKGRVEEARRAFEEAVEVDGGVEAAVKKGLERLAKVGILNSSS